MNRKDLRIVLFLLIFLFPSIYITINNPITAEDWNRHIVWVDRYISGDLTPFLEYPPVFHLFMILPVILMDGFIKYFQIVLAFLSGLAIALTTYKLHGKDATALVLVILFSSIDFINFSMAFMPQGLDYVILCLTMVFFLNDRYKLTALGLIILFYNHLSAIMFFMAFLIYSFKYKPKFLKYCLLVFLIALPMIIIYEIPQLMWWNPDIQIFGYFSTHYQDANLMVHEFMTNGQYFSNEWYNYWLWPPQNFFLFSSVVMWLLIPVALYKKRHLKSFTDAERLYIILLICLTPLFFYNALRWLTYIIVPLAMLESSLITRRKNGN